MLPWLFVEFRDIQGQQEMLEARKDQKIGEQYAYNGHFIVSW